MAKTYSCILVGLDVVEVEIETIVGVGFSGLTILGLRSDIIRDMRERVRSALESIGIPIPAKRVVVNIGPQEILKLSRVPLQELDFAVAACVILALFADQGIELPNVGKEFFAGELTLSGKLKPAQNTLVYEKIANSQKITISLNMPSNTENCVFFENHESLESWIAERKQIKTNSDKNFSKISHANEENLSEFSQGSQKFSESSIQNIEKNIKVLLKNPKACVASLVAVAGNHHLLLAGEPGIGKSFSIHRIKHLLLPPTLSEQIEIKLIHSHKFIPNTRPFRSPHHSCTMAALVGGYSLKPGEVTLAHRGVLVLDEIAEFPRNALEALREPLDSGRIELSKTLGNVNYPAKFLLCATTNPCPCGYFLSRNTPCRCKPTDSRQYISKISGPLLDRFCLQLWMESPNKMTIENKDIFSNYLLTLNDAELKEFSHNFLVVQENSQARNEPEELNCTFDFENNIPFSENYISFRAQSKIARLKNTFQKLFPTLSHENNFTDDILKYRNLSELLSKNLVH